ncbi:MAG: NAD-dependent epimerase/dehydratase family protein, partial [Paraglaciecola sp.]|nr:NAD-dependent epimerase/dehydratase family protein [Paraglaciecola sp.]
MKVLITGAKGTLGSVIYKSFLKRDLQVVPYSHSMDLSLIDWDSIDFVINCAAVVPGINVSNDKYVDGNIVFLQKILPYCAGKKFIHFSSLSE